MQTVIIEGYLTANPSVLSAQGSGKKRASFRVLETTRFRKADGTPGERTTGFNCICFNEATAEKYIGPFARKGSRVVIQGHVENDTWTGKDGVEHYDMRVIVGDIPSSSSTSFRTPPSPSMISSIRSSGAAAPSSRVSETTNKGSWAGPARDQTPSPDWKQTSMLCGCPCSSTFVLHRISSPSSMSSHASSTHRRHRSWPRQASLSTATWPRFGTARHALKKRAISRRGWLAT